MDRRPWTKRWRYALDNQFSRGSNALILWLGLLTLAVISLSALMLTLYSLAPGGETGYTFLEAAWASLLRTLGSGTLGGRDSVWGFRLLMLGVTLFSVFIYSTLISILTNGMRSRLDELRKGRSEVMESNHTVLLGWSEQIFSIIPELVQANASEARSCLVILADKDKVEMEDQIRQRIVSTGRTRLVCRTGSPMEQHDLNLVSLNTARNILVLTPESPNPDADVIKVVLAILNHPNRRKEPYHIVAALRSQKNCEVAKVVGKEEVEWVQSGEMISKMVAQTCRQSGLSAIYTQLLDFRGNEIYFAPAGALAGKTYGQALLAAERDTVLGIYTPENGAAGRTRLNPPGDTLIQTGDQVLVISSDNHQIALDPSVQPELQRALISNAPPAAQKPERTLILGWNWRGYRILQELDQYVAPGSQVQVIADQSSVEKALAEDCADLANQQVCFQLGDTTDRQTLEKLGLRQYDHVVVLCYSDRLAIQQADAQTLITLLHLRDIAQREQLKFSIVGEILDVRNRRLAAVTRADDFIVSDRFVSLMLAQVAESKPLNRVWADLFSSAGAEIYLRPAANYVHPGEPVNFYTVVEAARCKNETAIGYRLAAEANDAERFFGIALNPKKSKPVTFSENDRIIVLADS